MGHNISSFLNITYNHTFNDINKNNIKKNDIKNKHNKISIYTSLIDISPNNNQINIDKKQN